MGEDNENAMTIIPTNNQFLNTINSATNKEANNSDIIMLAKMICAHLTTHSDFYCFQMKKFETIKTIKIKIIITVR